MNTSKYYTPTLEEFHIGFRFETELKDEWYPVTVNYKSFILWGKNNTLYRGIQDNSIRVKYLDQQDIEELRWSYTGRSTELWFGIPEADVQPFNLTYRSFRLSYNLTDHRCRIIGYEYNNYISEEEDLFLGKIKNYNELKQVMKFLNII